MPETRIFIVLKGNKVGLISTYNEYVESLSCKGSVGHSFKSMKDAKDWIQTRVRIHPELSSVASPLLELPDTFTREDIFGDDVDNTKKIIKNKKYTAKELEIRQRVSSLSNDPVLPTKIDIPEKSVIVAQKIYIPKKVIVYTDGSFGNTASGVERGGFGILFVKYNGDPIASFACHCNDTNMTSIRMELLAVYEALNYIKHSDDSQHEIVVYTDCLPICNILNKKNTVEIYNYIMNDESGDLVLKIHKILLNPRLNIFIRKVAAHSGNRYNETVDRLSRLGAITRINK